MFIHYINIFLIFYRNYTGFGDAKSGCTPEVAMFTLPLKSVCAILSKMYWFEPPTVGCAFGPWDTHAHVTCACTRVLEDVLVRVLVLENAGGVRTSTLHQLFAPEYVHVYSNLLT